MCENHLPKHFKENSIDDWVKFFCVMYEKANRDRLPAILWLEAIDEATKLAEEARKNRPSQILRRAVTLFGWLCGFVGKYTVQPPPHDTDPIGDLLKRRCDGDGCEESLGGWVWMKFPGRCPVCAGEKCLCPSYRKLAEDRHTFDVAATREKLVSPDTNQSQKEFLQRQLNEHEDYLRLRKTWHTRVLEARKDRDALKSFLGKPLDQQIDMFVDIFGGSQFDLDLLQITSKLLEEAGEVAREIIALSELWEIKKRLKDGTLPEQDRQGLQKGLETLLAADQHRLPPDFVEGLRAKSRENLVEAVHCFCEDAANSLKGELADVFSWLTAVLYKVGTSLCEYREVQVWYQFSDIIMKHHQRDSATLCCPECLEATCDRLCLWMNICRTILEDKKKEYKRDTAEQWEAEEISPVGGISTGCGAGC
ncbi:MAG: hypothetical protein HY667_04490 [Chloroflexi bacterium]|nr:hypothetical protein [Chloroflexota bacterium]